MLGQVLMIAHVAHVALFPPMYPICDTWVLWKSNLKHGLLNCAVTALCLIEIKFSATQLFTKTDDDAFVLFLLLLPLPLCHLIPRWLPLLLR